MQPKEIRRNSEAIAIIAEGWGIRKPSAGSNRNTSSTKTLKQKASKERKVKVRTRKMVKIKAMTAISGDFLLRVVLAQTWTWTVKSA